MEKLNKIIYFDKETISNILQELNKGNKTIQTGISSSIRGTGELDMEAKVNLSMPLIKRISFMFTGKLDVMYIKQRDSTTTLTSTEISEFEKLKGRLKNINWVQVKDIENSSTFLRVAGGYLRMIKGGVDEVDVKEFNSVMDSYDGYDTYKISDKEYVRFNNSAFVSNYKRNDLLTTKLNLYCIPVGEFEYVEFDFLQQIDKMDNLITGFEKNSTLADVYPSEIPEESSNIPNPSTLKQSNYMIKLYDVVYASIATGDKDE